MSEPETQGAHSVPRRPVKLTVQIYLDLLDDERFHEGWWRDNAACVVVTSDFPEDFDPMDWFPDDDETVPAHVKWVCEECPVRIECLTYAIMTRQNEGIWAGRSVKELRTVRRRLMKVIEDL